MNCSRRLECITVLEPRKNNDLCAANENLKSFRVHPNSSLAWRPLAGYAPFGSVDHKARALQDLQKRGSGPPDRIVVDVEVQPAVAREAQGCCSLEAEFKAQFAATYEDGIGTSSRSYLVDDERWFSAHLPRRRGLGRH